MDRKRLDDYITGHYGEDQFRAPEYPEKIQDEVYRLRRAINQQRLDLAQGHQNALLDLENVYNKQLQEIYQKHYESINKDEDEESR